MYTWNGIHTFIRITIFFCNYAVCGRDKIFLLQNIWGQRNVYTLFHPPTQDLCNGSRQNGWTNNVVSWMYSLFSSYMSDNNRILLFFLFALDVLLMFMVAIILTFWRIITERGPKEKMRKTCLWELGKLMVTTCRWTRV